MRQITIPILLVLLLHGLSHARTWHLADGTEITGDIVSVDRENIRFSLPNGTTKNVPLLELTEEDLKVVKLYLEVQTTVDHTATVRIKENAASYAIAHEERQTASVEKAEKLLEQSVRIQSEQFKSQWYSLWYVGFTLPNGYRRWEYVPARNSLQAMDAVRRSYPGARFTWIQKYRRKSD